MTRKLVRYTAAGGIVFDGDRVLVLRRPHSGETRLPKGHVEDGETAEATALREVAEESGYQDLEIVADLGERLIEFDREHPVDGPQRVARVERYFVMRTGGAPPGAPEPQFVPEWLPATEAIFELTYPAEREWLRLAMQRAPER